MLELNRLLKDRVGRCGYGWAGPESVEDCNEGTRFLGLVRDRFENAVSPTPSESSESPLSADPHWPEIHVKSPSSCAYFLS